MENRTPEAMLDHIKVLEDYIWHLERENALLRRENANLRFELDGTSPLDGNEHDPF